MQTYDEPADASSLPQPYRLHWGWVLLLTIFTGGLFGAVWLLVISQWLRRVRGKSQAYGWAWAFVVCSALGAASSKVTIWLDVPVAVATLVLFFVVSFLLRDELERPPVGLSLSGAMTFFFSAVYFQYHLRRFGDRTFQNPGKTYTV